MTIIKADSQLPASPLALNGLDLWGHSWIDQNNVGNSVMNWLPNTNSTFPYMLAASLGVPASQVINHAGTGAQITNPVRGASWAGCGFAKVLAEINKTKGPYLPFARNGNAHLVLYGINDIGNTSSANQSLLRSSALDIYTVLIAKMRSSYVVDANGGIGLSYSGTWGAANAAAIDYTGGHAYATSTTGGVFTYQIPAGYRGEPICFSMIGYASANTCSVTWGGTAGVTGTTNLASRSVNAQSIVPLRITNLTSANSGQTITGTVALSSQTFILDGVFVGALKPVPVLLCNTPTLPCRAIPIASGAGVTSIGSTTFTDSSVNFSATTDTGAVLIETDAQGAFTGNTNTISSVTNSTTVVLTQPAIASRTAVQYTVARVFNGYATNGYSNANFSGATVASHSAADTDVTNWNTNVIAAVASLFDNMVQVVDLQEAIGSDANLPSTIYSWFDEVTNLHLNEVGNQVIAYACWNAITKLQGSANDMEPIGVLQNTASAAYRSTGRRRTMLANGVGNGANYLPDGAQIDIVANAYTAVAGDLFAYPFLITEPTIYGLGISIEQIGATGTSIVRVGIYDDNGGPGGPAGYPSGLRADVGLTTLTASNSVQNIGALYRPLQAGLWWLVFGISSLGTASTLRTVYGPSDQLPSWTGIVNDVVRPIAWKVTGQSISGGLPGVFPSGGSLVGCAGGTFTSSKSAPLVSIFLSVF